MGPPPKPSVSGFGGERRSNEMIELSSFDVSERYGVCDAAKQKLLELRG